MTNPTRPDHTKHPLTGTETGDRIEQAYRLGAFHAVNGLARFLAQESATGAEHVCALQLFADILDDIRESGRPLLSPLQEALNRLRGDSNLWRMGG
jgi:hypothetical protein